VLADQAGDLTEVVHQIQEKGITMSTESKEAIRQSLGPCITNLNTLAGSFPVLSDEINTSMREQDKLLREIITLQYRLYLQRFASRQSPSGSEFSRALFQVEGMDATIREIRKSSRLLRKV
jgi:hypothetical protein